MNPVYKKEIVQLQMKSPIDSCFASGEGEKRNISQLLHANQHFFPEAGLSLEIAWEQTQKPGTEWDSCYIWPQMSLTSASDIERRANNASNE